MNLYWSIRASALPLIIFQMNRYLRKGFIQVFVGISLCFIAPLIVSQAFNNQDHPFFLFVLIFGAILLVLAIFCGYRGINNILNGTLGPKNKLNWFIFE